MNTEQQAALPQRDALDAAKVSQTIERLCERIEDRFPRSGLAVVARRLHERAEDSAETLAWIERPDQRLRIGIGLILLALVAVLLLALGQVPLEGEALTPTDLQMNPKLGLILLEDLGDLTLERKFWENQDQTQALPFYSQAVDELIKIHFAATEDENPNCSAFQVQFDTEKFLWEMNYARSNLLQQLFSLSLSPLENKILDEVFVSICETLHQQPKRISHRDYHSRNLMLKLGKMRVIDFQDARRGPVQYDLVSLIHDSYVKLSPKSENVILKDYLSKAKAHGFDSSLDEFQRIYRIQLLQRCFKACGSFSSFYNHRKDTRYLKYIHPTLQKVFQTLDLFPEYKQFQTLLSDHGVLDLKIEDICAP